jgi:glycosyltransferase involved in cell wall biosynthesis
VSDLSVLVLQNGARHHYAIPAVLERAGLLAAFYTDVAGNIGLGKVLSMGRFLPLLGPPLARLAARQVTGDVTKKTVAFPVASVCAAFFGQAVMRRQMLRAGLRGANLVYSSLGWGRPLIDEARQHRIPVVTEIYVRPSLWRTYQEEYRAFSDWEDELPFAGLENQVGGRHDPCAVSDYVIVPAEDLAEDVAEMHQFPRDRICVVPYGINERFFQIKNSPVVGRVFFAGNCCLGKGIHYLAMAAERLLSKYGSIKFQFRAAGDVSKLVRKQPVCRGLEFLGRIPRTEMAREYEVADVFVLPTLSDASAGVTYEALAAGIPVITTRDAGSVVRDGIEGRIVPSRDPEALADAIAEIVENRQLRERMAQAARERAREFTWERYGERLVAVLKEFTATKIETDSDS